MDDKTIKPYIISNKEEEFWLAAIYGSLLSQCSHEFDTKVQNCGILFSDDNSVINCAIFVTINGKKHCVKPEKQLLGIAQTLWNLIKDNNSGGYYYVIDTETTFIDMHAISKKFVKELAETGYDYNNQTVLANYEQILEHLADFKENESLETHYIL